MFINSLNYFRGISILFIITGHSYWLVGWQINSFVEKTIANFITGGTVLFVFISGFLFHHVFSENIDYISFLASKIKKILFPYLILSGIFIAYFIIVDGAGDHFIYDKEGVYYEYIKPAMMYLLTGRTTLAYWYIPFIMIIFALTPLFIFFITLQPIVRILIILILLSVSIIVHRPVGNISVIQSVVYFTPVYLLGIFFSIHKKIIYDYLEGKEIYLLLITIALAMLQAAFIEGYGNSHKQPFELTFPDLIIVQKIFLCIFFIIYLHRFEEKDITILNKLASASFAIYLLHPFVFLILEPFINHENITLSGGALWLIITPLTLLLSYVIAIGIRKFVPAHSKLIIGW